MKSSLGQYYTNENISNLLVSRILNKNPNSIIELGIGDGSLAKAAIRRWKYGKIIGVDIDEDNILNIKKEFPSIEVFLINGTSSKLNKFLNISYGSVDVAICNPPYITIDKTPEIESILINSQLGDFKQIHVVNSDLIFLAQNIRLLKNGGELAIILPDGLITSHQFEKLRDNILKKYLIKGIIELPEKIFQKTEAKTHILILKKQKPNNRKIKLYKANKDGKIENTISISKKLLSFRMDFSYHYWSKNNISSNNKISDFNPIIKRGKNSKKELQLSGIEFIHTSDLAFGYQTKRFKTKQITSDKYRYAVKGDILIPRVGKRCLNKIMLIEQGNIPVSDCIYIIRINNRHHRNDLIKSLNSKKGRDWIEAHSHGVCAKVISKRDLLEYTI